MNNIEQFYFYYNIRKNSKKFIEKYLEYIEEYNINSLAKMIIELENRYYENIEYVRNLIESELKIV